MPLSLVIVYELTIIIMYLNVCTQWQTNTFWIEIELKYGPWAIKINVYPRDSQIQETKL